MYWYGNGTLIGIWILKLVEHQIETNSLRVLKYINGSPSKEKNLHCALSHSAECFIEEKLVARFRAQSFTRILIKKLSFLRQLKCTRVIDQGPTLSVSMVLVFDLISSTIEKKSSFQNISCGSRVAALAICSILESPVSIYLVRSSLIHQSSLCMNRCNPSCKLSTACKWKDCWLKTLFRFVNWKNIDFWKNTTIFLSFLY